MIVRLFYYFLCFQFLSLEFCVGDGRIFNGYPIDIEKVPYQAAVYIQGEFKCGGVILSKSWVLTVRVKFKKSQLL